MGCPEQAWSLRDFVKTRKRNSKAARSASLRTVALHARVISIDQALEMPGGFGALMQDAQALLSEAPTVPYPPMLCSRLLAQIADADAAGGCAAIGRYLVSHPATPWIRTVRHVFPWPAVAPEDEPAGPGLLLDEEGTLGFAAVICAYVEMSGHVTKAALPETWYPLGKQTLLFERYITCWYRRAIATPLPDLSVPAKFRQVFRDWVEGRVNFVEVHRE